MVASHGIESKERLAATGGSVGWQRPPRDLSAWRRSAAQAPRAPPVSPKAVNASEEFLGQRDDDARRASHVAESVLVLVLGHLTDEFGAVGAQASDSVVHACDCKHDAPEREAGAPSEVSALRKFSPRVARSAVRPSMTAGPEDKSPTSTSRQAKPRPKHR